MRIAVVLASFNAIAPASARLLGEDFDAPFARLDWIARNRFDIQWHRHTGEWFCLHRGLTLAEAIDTLSSRIAPFPLNTASQLSRGAHRCPPDGYEQSTIITNALTEPQRSGIEHATNYRRN